MDTGVLTQEKHADESAETLGGERPDFLKECEHREKELIRKVDWRLLPVLGALYAVALVDRINISNARIAGMEEELGLDIGNRYSVALLVFFIPFFLFEIPSNIILRRVGSANWLGFITFGWGTFMLGAGFITNYESLVVFRFLLGFFEAGFFPGCIYLISCWYVRYEVQTRLAAFLSVSVITSAFSSMIAVALMQMEGIAGYRGWRWIFIIEGLATQVIAIVCWSFIIEFPDKASATGFLTENEAKYIQYRIEKDRGDSVHDALTWAKLFTLLRDVKLWIFASMLLSITMPSYGFGYFGPVIIMGMGHSAEMANLLTAPPILAAIFAAIGFSWLSDKYQIRAPLIMFNSAFSIIGMMLIAFHPSPSIRYLGLFIGQIGCIGNVPSILAYQSNNIRGQSKRSVGSALQIGFGSTGGIMASTIFRQEESPRYVTGLWTAAGLQVFILLGAAGTSFHFRRRNRQVDNGTIKKPIEGLEGFKYTL